VSLWRASTSGSAEPSPKAFGRDGGTPPHGVMGLLMGCLFRRRVTVGFLLPQMDEALAHNPLGRRG